MTCCSIILASTHGNDVTQLQHFYCEQAAEHVIIIYMHYVPFELMFMSHMLDQQSCDGCQPYKGVIITLS